MQLLVFGPPTAILLPAQYVKLLPDNVTVPFDSAPEKPTNARFVGTWLVPSIDTFNGASVHDTTLLLSILIFVPPV